MLQTLPHRVWLLLEEFQTCSGSRTELLGIFRILWQARIPSLATTLPQRVWMLLEEFQAGPGNRTDLLGCSGKLTWFLWLLHGWLLSARFLPKAPCQKLLAKSSLPKAPCCHRVGPRGNWSPMSFWAPGSGARDVMLTVALRALIGWWLQGPFNIPQIKWNALGLAGAPFSSPLLSFPLLSSPLLSSPLLSSPLLSSPLLSSPLLSSPLLSSPLLSSPLLSSPLLPSPPLPSPLLPSPPLSSPLLSSPLLSSPLVSSPLLSSPILTQALAAEQSCWEPFRSGAKLTLQILHKPGHKVSGCCFLKSSRQARAAEQSCWQSFGSSGKLTFQVLLQPW